MKGEIKRGVTSYLGVLLYNFTINKIIVKSIILSTYLFGNS